MIVAGVMAAACALYAPPGVLLYLWLRTRGLQFIPALGLGLALLTVLYAALASAAGYHFWRQLAATLLLDGVLLWLALRGSVRLRLPKAQPWQLLLVAVIGSVYLAPALLIPVPFDTDAQGFGLLIATVRASGSITTLAPFFPNISWFYSPGYFLLGAQLADLTGARIHEVMLGLSHVLALGVVAGVGALGRKLGGSTTGWWAAVACAGGVALFTTLLDGAYTNVYGIWLMATFLWLLDFALASAERWRIGLAGASLAAVLLGHPDSIIHLLMGYLPFYGAALLALPRLSGAQYRRLALWVPLAGVAFSLPWLLRVLPLVPLIEVHERQTPQLQHLLWLAGLNGVWLPLAALAGVWWALRRRHWLDVWCVVWLLPIVELSSFGNLNQWSQRTALDPLQVLYPLGIAWHATIIPLPLLAARALQPLGAWIARAGNWQRYLTLSLGALLAVLALGIGLQQQLVQWSHGRVMAITGALATPADIAAYDWLRANTPPTALLLNYPGRFEGQWAPVIAERPAVFIRDQLFYIGANGLRSVQPALEAAYMNPDRPAACAQLRVQAIAYLVVPQALAHPERWQQQLRWRAPAVWAQRPRFEASACLALRADFDGAQVWQVIGAS